MKTKFLAFTALTLMNASVLMASDEIFKAASFKMEKNLLALISKPVSGKVATCSYHPSKKRVGIKDMKKISIDAREYFVVSKAVSGNIKDENASRKFASNAVGDNSIKVLRDVKGSYYCLFSNEQRLASLR